MKVNSKYSKNVLLTDVCQWQKVGKFAADRLIYNNNNNILLIISIFKEDNIFSIIASLPYSPPVVTDIDYYRTFLDFFMFVSVAMLVVRYL